MVQLITCLLTVVAMEHPGGIEQQLSAKLQPILDAMAAKYDMAVGLGLRDSAGDIGMALAAGIKASRFVIVSDETVFGLYGQTLVDAFVAAGHTPLTFQVKPGENSKCAAAARAAAVSSVWL